MATPDLLIFDCDGVLVDSERLAVEAFVQVLNDAGVPATPAMLESCFGLKQADILISVAEQTGKNIPPEVGQTLWPVTRSFFERSLQPMPGVADFLDRPSAMKRCVASSSNPERIRLSLELAGLGHAFGDAVFSSHQVARGKPAPDLFLFAATTLGIAPTTCLVVEDSTFGVQAALAAGMQVIAFTGGSHITPDHAAELMAAGPTAIAANWNEVAEYLGG